MAFTANCGEPDSLKNFGNTGLSGDIIHSDFNENGSNEINFIEIETSWGKRYFKLSEFNNYCSQNYNENGLLLFKKNCDTNNPLKCYIFKRKCNNDLKYCWLIMKNDESYIQTFGDTKIISKNKAIFEASWVTQIKDKEVILNEYKLSL